jgi:hypothetical protein
VVAERPVEVEDVIVGIDEEVRAAGPLDVVEGGDRRGDQRARAEGAAGFGDDHAEPVLLAEPVEQVDQPRLAAGHPDLERRAAQLARRMHALGFLDTPGR